LFFKIATIVQISFEKEKSHNAKRLGNLEGEVREASTALFNKQ
jgi:hypothetical protein